ncbi:MAG: PAS domain S-box protein [Bacteroidota bacterium]
MSDERRESPSNHDSLRQQADDSPNDNSPAKNADDGAAQQKMFPHEVAVRRVDHEMQNLELLIATERAESATQKYSALFDFAPFAYFVFSRSGEILELNLHGSKLLGGARSHLLHTRFHSFISPDSRSIFNDFIEKVFNSGVVEVCELTMISEGELPIIVHLSGRVTDEVDSCLVSAVDVTGIKRSETILASRQHLLQYSEQHSVADLLTKTLDEIEKLTASRIGFYHFLEEDQTTLSLQAWSSNTISAMCSAKGDATHYKISEAGVWVDCVRAKRPVVHNDYASLTHRKGLPSGHTPVIRELVVPVFRKDRIVAILGVGNKSVDYTDTDVECVANLADFAWDMVERKQIEDELRRTQAFRQAIEQTLQSGIAIVDQQGIQVYVNPFFCQLLGWTEKELLGKQAPFIYWPEDQLENIDRAFKETISNSAPPEGYELVFARKDGVRMPVQINISPFSDGSSITGWLANVVDISKRKLQEAELLKKDALLEITGYTAKVGGWEFDPATSIQTWTEEVYRIHELESDFLPDVKSGINFYTPASRPVITEAVRRAVSFGEPFDLELEILTAKGNLRTVRSIGRAHQADGVTIKVFGSVQDITESKEEKLRIVQQNAELKILNAEKDKFFSIIAHDLKSPFNAIIGLSSALAEQCLAKSLDGVEKYAEIILESSERAMDLLNNLMLWSRAHTGRMAYSPEHFEMEEVVQEIILLFSNAASQKGTVITHDLPDNEAIFADKYMISTVLRNLISNAIKFTPRAGKIHIATVKNQEGLTVSIRDNGVGISEGKLALLFHLDEDYSTAGTDNEKGTGLGLILCKEFVEKHGGKIRVQSEPGKGSEFSFSIPDIGESA